MLITLTAEQVEQVVKADMVHRGTESSIYRGPDQIVAKKEAGKTPHRHTATPHAHTCTHLSEHRIVEPVV